MLRSPSCCAALSAFCSPGRRPRRPPAKAASPHCAAALTHRQTNRRFTPTVSAASIRVLPALTLVTATRRNSASYRHLLPNGSARDRPLPQVLEAEQHGQHSFELAVKMDLVAAQLLQPVGIERLAEGLLADRRTVGELLLAALVPGQH